MTPTLSFRRRVLALGAVVLSAALSAGAETHVLLPEDHLALTAVSDPQLSPDGRQVAFVVGTVEGKSKRKSTVWIAPADGAGAPRAFTPTPQSPSPPGGSPGGGSIAFLPARPPAEDAKGPDSKTQVYVLSFSGGEARRLTSLEDGVRSFSWSP